MMRPPEANVVINGQQLTSAQSMTLRVAVQGMLSRMNEPDALGTDEHGVFMRKAYRARLGELQELLVSP